jgi:hypothetical protein
MTGYQNYPDDLERLEELSYVTTENLQNMIIQLEGIQFALQSQRTQGLQIVSGVERLHHVFSDTVRFPDKTANNKRFSVVCIDLKDWPFKFEQLESALNYKVPDVAQTNKNLSVNSSNFQSNNSNNKKTQQDAANNAPDDSTKCITSLDERDKFEKAMKTFTTGVADVKRQIKDAVLTRRIFENTYSLIWKD